jgi:hypothetical protein
MYVRHYLLLIQANILTFQEGQREGQLAPPALKGVVKQLTNSRATYEHVCRYSSLLNLTGSLRALGRSQRCQMVYFQTKNRNLVKFWRVSQWKMLVYCMAPWCFLWTLDIFYGHLVYFVF